MGGFWALRCVIGGFGLDWGVLRCVLRISGVGTLGFRYDAPNCLFFWFYDFRGFVLWMLAVLGL